MDYKQISYGSRGDDVKQVQTLLNKNGYQLDVDGQFGPKTQAAVKDYQKKNSLSVDGIVGKNTWGALNANKTASTQAVDDAPKNNTTPSNDSYVESDIVKQANALLQQHMANKPGDYSGQYADQIQGILDQIMNRPKFQYDLNGDAIYKQYAQQYAQQGKMAMMDTMGQAAAMTGGYGNSYAQSVGQQTYQGYMQQLNQVMPELYGMALDQYNQEGQQLLNQYGVLTSQDEQEYGRHRDQVSDYYTELQRLTEDARYVSEDEYGKWIDDRNYNYQKDRDAVEDDQWERSFKYQQERDSVADQQWAKEFEEAQRQYNESKKASSTGGGGSTETYEMSASEYEKWHSMWAGVETEADAKFLRENMINAGVPEELAFSWYAWFSGDYEDDEEPQDTNVEAPKNTGGSVGSRGANGDPITRRELYN